MNWERIGVAWAAWKASGRFLFWTWVEVLTAAISARKQAAMELTALHPKEPKDCWNGGYALFLYDMGYDKWTGTHRAVDYDPRQWLMPQFTVTHWAGVPWHKVTFPPECGLPPEVRAVALAYCRKHLTAEWGNAPMKDAA